MTRIAIALAIALALSLLGNGLQLYRAGGAGERADAALQAARDAGAIAALHGRLDVVNGVARAADADNVALLAYLASLVERGRERVTEFRTVERNLPPMPGNCGPGAARVEAFNRLSGATP
ncbi:hypothetical protein [Marilutibacter spongiae]|uniref:DUF2570 domain-containing protein n=1 Tax=Marilutibacter spongiae TaxID=2025720 RepID=A0A7W3TP37_9GAMM|nr:hypothetical protein [Lysobacter spongiae]MBB1061887.1 hypothetical protein [Lysobacter spongiae]